MGDINIIEEILTENCEIESFNCSLYDKDKNKFISVNWEIADEVNKLDDSEVLEWKSRLI
jgi:phenylacetate-coenzyme A ligase PaaK-like adenylate-forming protein